MLEWYCRALTRLFFESYMEIGKTENPFGRDILSRIGRPCPIQSYPVAPSQTQSNRWTATKLRGLTLSPRTARLTALVHDRPEDATGEIFSVVASAPAAQSLRRRVEEGGLFPEPVSPGAQSFVAALLARLFPERPIVVVTAGLKLQEIFQQDLETWTGAAAKPLFYPDWEILPHEGHLPHADVVSDRLATLVALAGHAPSAVPPVIVANVTALLQKTIPAAELKKRIRTLRQGESLNPLDLIEWLEEQFYEPEAQVTEKGHVAMRGGIVDVWPLASPWPVRLEFFGDELESLRYFDPISQVSREEIRQMTIAPGGEIGLLKKDKGLGAASLLEYLPRETLFILCEPDLLDDQARHFQEQVPAGDPLLMTWRQFQEEMQTRGMTTVPLTEFAPAFIGDAVVEGKLVEPPATLGFQSLEVFRPIGNRRPEPPIAEAQRQEFFKQLHRWRRQDYAVYLFCNNVGERERFEEIWREYGLGETGALKIRLGALSRGFLSDTAKLVVVTDAEIFGRYKVQRPRRLKSPHAASSRSLLDINFAELEEGDYVVHLQHGIGRFLGLKSMPDAEGTPGQECLMIEYAASGFDEQPPKLYVPLSESHLVSKYVGAGKARPPLNTLTGQRWAKTRAQAEHAVRDIAAEMLAIQAARSAQLGHAFPLDTGWQHEFENSFIYEETPDQARAIIATKEDMEAPKPMDRLICGDVGYGKTEVAIRAAFKAALGGKQAAVLVPTTVLAQQHFNTFRERMADYPVRIELLSRFRSRREQDRVVRELAAGSVDIVIGTHRLLQGDIRFKDLGLVVIDEEQRFGVMHKERFKKLRTLVDVLTLTATPIPRTLYLALAGARDMSTIETPPQDRLPVQTIVAPFDERLIRDAIQRELNRGGQVFYLHNRVLDIEAAAGRLRALVPAARIVVGHGQMHGDQLEQVMASFVNGDCDVLLSTTIIESGLDIPNANTIIIDRADRFGLSDLYQLRGRVGRYKHQAYAFLLLPRHAGLLTDARKRLSAIKQYSSLGSGFKIAMRDLEIRGAGNLLGAEQSGHITAVGFELYCRLLKHSVGKLKGEIVRLEAEVTVRLDFLATHQQDAGACLPAGYIAEPQHRIEMYRKLAQALDPKALSELRKELRDRFGPLPNAAELALKVADLKLAAAAKGLTLIEVKEDKLMLKRHDAYVMAKGKFPRLRERTPAARLKEIKKAVLTLQNMHAFRVPSGVE
jgi:transcription-repair coupling factor (superfamily II helicase)